MPLRSPKMYFCIFGFQRLVWWPKCTPASSSSFIVIAAILPPRFASAALRARCPYRSRAACVVVLPRSRLCRVLRVQPDVLLAEIARPDRLLAPAQAEVDRDRVLPGSHDLVNSLGTHALAEHPALDQRLVVEADGDLVLIDARRRLAERHHDAAPV